MGYNPFRDRADLRKISEEQQVRIHQLADRLEQVAGQAYHDDECGCPPGRSSYARCMYGPMAPTVSSIEIIAALLMEGRLHGHGLLDPETPLWEVVDVTNY